MFMKMMRFELRNTLCKISTWLLLLLFAAAGFIGIYRASFGGGYLTSLLNTGSEGLMADAPFTLYYLIAILTDLGIIVTLASFASSAGKDFSEEFFPLHFSYPVKKAAYLGTRMASAMFRTLLVLSGAGLGALIAVWSGMCNPENLTGGGVAAIIYPYLVHVLPNTIFFGSLFFTLVLLSRRQFSAYAGFIAVISFFLVSSLWIKTSSYTVGSILDPFGHNALKSMTGYWTLAQKNALYIPLTGNLLLNRIVWAGASLLIIAFAAVKFEFSQGLDSMRQRTRKDPKHAHCMILAPEPEEKQCPPALDFGALSRLSRILKIASIDFRATVLNKYFALIFISGAAAIFLYEMKAVGLVRNTQTFPVTSQVLDATKLPMYLFSLFVTTLCAAMIVWRERNEETAAMLDALPGTEWIQVLGKTGALVLINLILASTVFLESVIVQAAKGYYYFEFTLYLKELFGIRLLYYFFMSVFAVTVIVFLNRKIAGAALALLLIDDLLPTFQLTHSLWRFGRTPDYIYSDMNGYGPFARPLAAYNLFWAFAAAALVILAGLFWVRGSDISPKARIREARRRLDGWKIAIAGSSALVCLMLGGWILYNTNVINIRSTEEYGENWSAGYERDLAAFDSIPQPYIDGIEAFIDIFPCERSADSRGTLTLENICGSDINEILVQIPPDITMEDLSFDVPGTLSGSWSRYGFYIYRLQRPMRFGVKIGLNYSLRLGIRGFSDGIQDTRIVSNGSFLASRDLVPAIGYDPYFDQELKNEKKRKKHGLPPGKSIPSPVDPGALSSLVTGKHSGWIDLDLVIGTDTSQTAVSSGDLVEVRQEGARRYFHYRPPQKVLNYFSVVSAAYQVQRDRWNDVDIEIYFHEGHGINNALFIGAIKSSLDYYTSAFSPYQFNQVRVVEFPLYNIYAEGCPGVIPCSEAYGFITRFDGRKVDYSYRVMAHEVAHMWWGHQVIGANVGGMSLLMEGLTQYSAMMVTRRRYDDLLINEYSKLMIDQYLRGRSRIDEPEVPLSASHIYVPFVNYEKSIVVMRALAEFLGEDRINGVLREYVSEQAFSGPPFTVSSDLIKKLRDAAPDTLSYLIDDMLETITIYDNKALSAACSRTDDGRYSVRLTYRACKYRNDGKGNEESAGMSDLVEFGIYGADGKELCLKRLFIGNEETGTVEITVDRPPSKAGIDPRHLLIDKDPDDNLADVRAAAETDRGSR